jgi:high-affinity iron transporter
MFGAAIIVFREALEAALIVGIIAAATRSVPGCGRWLAAGLLAGVAGSIMVAGGMEVIAQVADGMGQELFNAGILSVAVAMLAWHNIWMSVHGKELARQAHDVGRQVYSGTRERSVVFAIVALAVLREGSETALFLYGIATTAGLPVTLAGGALGLGAGIAVGWTLYAGLLRIPLRWFFLATSALVLLLAAGLASQAASFLVQADLLPSLGAPIWDTSAALPPNSVLGTLLHGLMGYDARPAGIQLLFYGAVLVAIASGMRWFSRPQLRIPRPSGASQLP